VALGGTGRAGAQIWVVRDLRRHAELLRQRGELRRADELLEHATNEARATGLAPAPQTSARAAPTTTDPTDHYS
jgi:hypothetical protein